MHHPVIYRNAKLLYRNVVFPTVPHDLTQNDEADRGLLRTGHHGQKSERICGIADFHLEAHRHHRHENRIHESMEVKS